MKATITYTYSALGQKASLIAGGDGKATQSISIDVAVGDIELFTVSPAGELSAEATRGWTPERYGGWQEHRFDAVPSPADLIVFLRERRVKRAEVEAANKAAETEARKAEMAKKAAARAKAIAQLRAQLAAGDTTGCSDTSCDIEDVRLWAEDAECGAEVAALLAIYREKQHKARNLCELQDKLDKAVPVHKPPEATTRLADGTYSFKLPTLGSSKDWARHVESIDAGAKNGYAFVGDWLDKSKASLPAGELVLIGGTFWIGSRRSGHEERRKKLYLVTPAGLCWIANTGDCLDEAKNYLALDPAERVERKLREVIDKCRAHIDTLGAFDRAEYAEMTAVIDERIAQYTARIEECQRAIDAGSGEASEGPIGDIDSAAEAIVVAGYRALAKVHHPDAGGSEDIMVLLTQARQQLRELLKLAAGVTA